MAKLPSAEDLGVTPAASGSRPIGGYDVAPFARASASMAQAGANFGNAVAGVGGAIADEELDKARYQYATAHADFLSKAIDLKSSLANDQDYGTLQQRYTDGINKALNDSAAGIELPGMRSRFTELMQPDIERGVAQMKQHAFGLEGDANVAYVQQQGDKFINQGTASPGDADLQGKLIGAYGSLVDGLAGRGWISQERALAMKQGWAHQYALADGVARADTDPQGVINELRAAPGSPQQIDNRIVQIESSGNPLARSKTSNALGLGQFEPATWLPLIKQYHPELSGYSDQQLLALRADKGLNMEMLAHNREQNTTYLQRNGVDATAGNIYLAHFLGPAGAAAVAKASPTAPVEDVLAGAVGNDMAAKMIAANPSVLKGQTAGGVAQWATARMGGVGPGGGHIYDILRPDQRAMLLSHAEAALNKQQVTDRASFETRVANSEAEAYTVGAPSQPIDQSEFISRYGADAGAQRFATYNEQLQAGRTINAMASMTSAQRADAVASLQPKAGDPEFALKQKAFGIAQRASASIDREVKADPAAFAASRLGASKSAWQDFQNAAGGTEDDRTTAAQAYAAVTLDDQARVGVAPAQQRVVPENYAKQLTAALQAAASSDDPKARTALIQRVQGEAQMWGQYWPQVMRQLAPGMQPISRAIAAGADQGAVTRLLSLDPKATAKSIVGEQNDVQINALTKSVNTAMLPFRQTLVGRQLDRDFPGYLGLTQKLAALYVRDGDDSDTAATKAFNALVGNRYEFRDNSWRMPKSAGVSADDVQAGAQLARGDLAKFGVKAPVDDMPGRTDAAATDLALLGRDGRWVTAPDNSGLNLAYNGKFARTASGEPFKLTWGQLAALSKEHPGLAAMTNDVMPGGE